MQLYLGVKNFAKIEEAKICINKYTLLVGQNNSGKTFLMQLVQGVGESLISLIDEDILQILNDFSTEYKKYSLGKHNILNFVQYINNKLDEKKEEIIKDIFGKSIDIERLYFDIELDDFDNYQIEIVDSNKFNNDVEVSKNFEYLHDFVNKLGKEAIICVLSRKDLNANKEIEYISITPSSRSEDIILLRRALDFIFAPKSLFLPASRTGLLHLYRDYFANRADDAVSYKMSDDKMIMHNEDNMGLTKPMYQFLRFLQTCSENEEQIKRYKDELKFFEENIIEGHISVNKQGVLSYSSHDESMVPMYLASSMINEVAPMALVLSCTGGYNKLIIDEIEASLHPQKQLELARFLNRLNKKNINLVLSTHSDTFASKINNLYLLSKQLINKEKIEKKEILEKFGLSENDLININNLFVYEFIIQANGKSIVKEIEPNEDGYQFDLFTGSALKLYEEAVKLREIQ